jgi:hypothetical protein
MTDQQREHTVRLETWMHAACMRSGPIGANRYRSKLHMTWVAHRAVLDRSMARWAARRLAPFLTVPVVAPPQATPVLSEIGSCTFCSSNVWGPDYVSLTNFQYAICDCSLVVLLPIGTSACN